MGPHDIVAAANRQFLDQTTFDPWVLSTSDPQRPLDPYLANGRVGYLLRNDGTASRRCEAGVYKDNVLLVQALPADSSAGLPGAGDYRQSLDLRTGLLTTEFTIDGRRITRRAAVLAARPGEHSDAPLSLNVSPSTTPKETAAVLPFWRGRDIEIAGDPEARQVVHACLFSLLSSTYPGSDASIPPMGLSSNKYGGHIFWDSEVWMLPALLAQYPEYARGIVNYRFRMLAQAKRNARSHGFQGAEYPWESAATGAEVAPGEFARERHITADVAFAVWEYYLWTGDRAFLAREGWPLLQATAQYWESRVTEGKNGLYHIRGVLSPDETAGIVDDDAYTNAVVRYNLRAAAAAARALGKHADPRWLRIAASLFLPFDSVRGIPAEHSAPLTDRFSAKQADTLLQIYPLGVSYPPALQGRMLDFYAAHTSKSGPAMTASIHAVIAARLGLSRRAGDYFHESYRPFMRAPWAAFSEKATTNDVTFLTGMAGCLQSVLYGFAGLHVYQAGEKVAGTKLAENAEASLYAAPHLPPGWRKLVLRGIRFHGRNLDLSIYPNNKISVVKIN